MTTPIPLHRTNYQAGPSGSPPPSPPPAYGTPYGSWESNASSNRENRRPSPPSSPSHSARSTSQIVDVVAKKTMPLKDTLWLLIDQAYLPQLRSVTDEQERAMDANMKALFMLFESCMPVMKTKIFSEKKRFYHPAFGNEKGPGEGEGNKVVFMEFFTELLSAVQRVKTQSSRLFTACQIVYANKINAYSSDLEATAKGSELLPVLRRANEYFDVLASNVSEGQWKKVFKNEPYDNNHRQIYGERFQFLKNAVEQGLPHAIGRVNTQVIQNEEIRTQENIANCDRRIAANNAATNAAQRYAATQHAYQQSHQPVVRSGMNWNSDGNLVPVSGLVYPGQLTSNLPAY